MFYNVKKSQKITSTNCIVQKEKDKNIKISRLVQGGGDGTTREIETNLLERPAPETDQQSSLYEHLSVRQTPKG